MKKPASAGFFKRVIADSTYNKHNRNIVSVLRTIIMNNFHIYLENYSWHKIFKSNY